jgi:hypothetical protein
MLGEGALRMESGIPWLATEARKKKRTPSVDLPTDRSVFSPFDPFNPYFPLLKARSRGSWNVKGSSPAVSRAVAADLYWFECPSLV